MNKEMYNELFKDVVVCGRYPAEKLEEMKWFIRSLEDKIEYLEIENKQLQNNWNELKEWLKLWVEEEKKLDDLVTTDYSLGDLIEDKEVILDKMQEIESRK